MVVKAIMFALAVAIIAALVVFTVVWYLNQRDERAHESDLHDSEQRHKERMRYWEDDDP